MSSTTLISINSGSLSFGKDTLFTNATFNIYKEDKVCLIGKNGSGKSTLLKVIGRELELDTGTIFINQGAKIGYLRQNANLHLNKTATSYILESIKTDDVTLQEQKTYLVDIILKKLNIKGDKEMKKMSGGQLRRVALAECLLGEPDILLLDEPTNHLDIASIEWLEEYLSSYKGALVFISHDRAFLNKLSNRTFWLDRGKLYQNNHGFKDFYEFREQVQAKETEELDKLSKELAKEEIWRMQGVTARRKRNQQRLGNFFTLRETLKQEQSRHNILKSGINLEASSEVKSRLIMEATDVSYEYNDVFPAKKIIKPFSLRLVKGEFIGIIGKNGSGKTTFLKLITGALTPTSGEIKLGSKVTISYFDQNRTNIDPDKTLFETICEGGGDTILVGGESKHVASYLKDFMFDAKQIKAKVATLSGGEQNRLMLAKLLANPGNLLILDEPTNDLDIDTLDMLQDVLSEYKGTLLIVSHDRDFMEKLVTRTIILDGSGSVEDYIGGYEDYLKEKLSHEKQVKKKVKKDKKEEKIKEPSKNLSYKYKRELELLPAQIESLSADIKELEKILSNSSLYAEDAELFAKATEQLSEKTLLLDELETRWLELEAMREG
jgi:ATP-binding cassette subfamily F protein uup